MDENNGDAVIEYFVNVGVVPMEIHVDMLRNTEDKSGRILLKTAQICRRKGEKS